jgi:hypothetical protein
MITIRTEISLETIFHQFMVMCYFVHNSSETSYTALYNLRNDEYNANVLGKYSEKMPVLSLVLTVCPCLIINIIRSSSTLAKNASPGCSIRGMTNSRIRAT